MQGSRVTREDAHAAVLDLQNLDGPSGENVHKILAKQPTFKDTNYEQALKDGFYLPMELFFKVIHGLCLSAFRSFVGSLWLEPN